MYCYPGNNIQLEDTKKSNEESTDKVTDSQPRVEKESAKSATQLEKTKKSNEDSTHKVIDPQPPSLSLVTCNAASHR